METQSSRVDTLIITVGTRQIGWRSQDGNIRSFGADGNGDYPPHVKELYQEIGVERGSHQEKEKSYSWGARDLGERYYEYCVHWLDGDFSRVELLLDHEIIRSGVKQGLKHIILWGTDQPEKVSLSYRRLDTLWLAKLMEGKIKSIWKDVRVDVYNPKIEANDREAIRQELELLVLPEALDFFSSSQDEQFVLWIQNKGCAPAIASGVEICVAALVRQCQVFNAIPREPDSFFEPQPNDSKSACPSLKYQLVAMGDYFWPLERLRVISAWHRGDFSEAQVWLKSHQNRQKLLYKLASILALAINWESSKFLNYVGDWLRSNDLAKLENNENIRAWEEQLNFIRSSRVIWVWETNFLIDLPLQRQNYTTAFIQFAQTLERLLYLHSQSGNFIGKGFITLPPNANNFINPYQPALGILIDAWCKSQRFDKSNKWYKLLDRIRSKRNEVIHSAEPVTLSQIRSIWSDDGLFIVRHTEEPEVLKELMMDVLKKVCDRNWQIPDKTLIRSLYDWGLNRLQAEAASF